MGERLALAEHPADQVQGKGLEMADVGAALGGGGHLGQLGVEDPHRGQAVAAAVGPPPTCSGAGWSAAGRAWSGPALGPIDRRSGPRPGPASRCSPR